jgi:hypothetical protein
VNFKGREVRVRKWTIKTGKSGARLLCEVALVMRAPEDGEHDPLRAFFAERVLPRPQLFDRIDYGDLVDVDRRDVSPEELERLELLDRRAQAMTKLECKAP